MILTTARTRFEASRCLPQDRDERLQRRHGHGFVVDVAAPYAEAVDRIAELSQALQGASADLDYSDLNLRLDTPSDAALAEAIALKLGAGSDVQVTISPTPNRRTERQLDGRRVSACRYGFEAAHFLPHVPEGHKCGRLHGHSFEVLIRASGVDYTEIDRAWQPWAALLSHHCLNDLNGLSNPTSEHLAQWLWHALKTELSSLLTVTVYETGRCGATFDGVVHSIWRSFTFDAAVQRSEVSPDDPRRRSHGHTYRLRLHLTGPLDPTLGWALDFGDVQRLFAPIYDALDHRAFATLDGLQAQSTIAVAEWIRERSSAALPTLTRIDLEETAGNGVMLCRGGPVPFLV